MHWKRFLQMLAEFGWLNGFCDRIRKAIPLERPVRKEYYTSEHLSMTGVPRIEDDETPYLTYLSRMRHADMDVDYAEGVSDDLVTMKGTNDSARVHCELVMKPTRQRPLFHIVLPGSIHLLLTHHQNIRKQSRLSSSIGTPSMLNWVE